jgi:hypothetical protein
MLLRFLASIGLLALLGCTRPELPATTVRADSAEALTAFRAELGQRFAAADLATFDTALSELQLAGMDRGLTTADARAAAMRAEVHGKSVRDVERLGYAARRDRFRSEIKLLTEMRDRDAAIRERTAATGTPRAVLDRIASAEGVMAKLERQLADTERQLATWSAADAVK